MRPEPPTYRFDRFELDLRRGCLLAEGAPVDLRPKAFQLLCHLVAHAGRLISKEELIQAAWPDVVVTDDALTKCISDIRAALSDDGQTLIKTVPRRGYVLVPPVTQERASATPEGDHGASIAVLPLENLSGDAQQDYFSDGLSESLTTALSRFAGLTVIAPNSAFKYKAQRPEPRVLGEQLSVRYLLEGSVHRQGERIRVMARLIDTRNAAQLWAEKYDRLAVDLFQVNDELTTKIVVSLIHQVSKSELDRSLRKAPESLAAWDHYVRGTAVLRNFTAGDRGPLLIRARDHFHQALAVEARYAPALQALAQTFTAAWLEPSGVEPIKSEYQQASTLDRGQALAEQALEIDPFLADAHATLAWILHWQYQRPAGLASFRRALELNPNLAEGRYSLMLTHAGHPEQGVAEMQRIMRLDPHHPALYWTWLGNGHYLLCDDVSALEALRVAGSRQPKHRPTHVWLAAAAARAGQTEEAQRAVQTVLQLQPDFTIGGFMRLLRLSRARDSERLSHGLRLAGFHE
jgi:adenylate cyclase